MPKLLAISWTLCDVVELIEKVKDDSGIKETFRLEDNRRARSHD